MKSVVNQKGFTLIELIIVIAILGILSTIMTPYVVGFINHAKISADQTTVRTLNSLTTLYGVENQNLQEDVFVGFNTDEERITQLVDTGFLSFFVKPQVENACFIWDIENQHWIYLVSIDTPLVYYMLRESDYEIGWASHVIGNLINESEKNIQLPEGIRSIKGGQSIAAFYEKGLKSVALPNSLQNIYSHAFYGNDIKEIVIPNEVTFIGTMSFYDNPITKVTMISEPEQVTIQDRVFGSGYVESKIITDAFKEAYENGGPGTYEWIDDTWVKTE